MKTTRQVSRRRFLAQASLPLTPRVAASSSARKPNVILIYADDLGYGDLGCYGGKLRTPNLDRMAREGMRFTHFVSANPVCSPSRAALLTGRYPTRVGVPRVLFPQDKEGLPDDEVTIAQMLKPLGYRTLCVGKWHLGHLPQYLPTNRGFDEYYGIPYSNDMNPRLLLHSVPGKVEILEEIATLETLTPRYTERAVRFIETSKEAPFFLYLPHTYPHIPLAASPRFKGKSPHGLYGDVVEELDWSVGEILAALKRHNLERDTLVLFSSDNGPWFLGSPGMLRGRKGTTYEGGVREPFLARMPGRIPAGKVCHGLASTLDILPTVAKLCGAPLPPKPLDGIDIWPLLSGARSSLEREVLLYFDNVHLQCARWGNYKLHVARYNSQVYSPPPAGGRINLPLPRPELYDLSLDPDESYDLAPERPDLVKEIQARMERVLATFPEPIQRAYTETAKKKTEGQTGAFPRLAQ
ncbi:MAG: sulfatase [Bryobacteraceae bacterium]|nr:sulfatase [Bryobacteraceae bacterium]MDW8380438.1 sulfatase [Bryobacterales bacterium]